MKYHIFSGGKLSSLVEQCHYEEQHRTVKALTLTDYFRQEFSLTFLRILFFEW